MKKALLLIPTLSLLWLGVHSQIQRSYHWYFGDQSGIDFSSGSPVLDTNGALISHEGSFSMSDTCGDLLFYCNGGNFGCGWTEQGAVWNRNHQLMPNGLMDDTTGCSSSRQSGIAVPLPGDPDKFYLFTTDCSCHADTMFWPLYRGLRYSIVDMSLDGGLGDVTVKGQHLIGDYSNIVFECVTAIRHANGKDYWILTYLEDLSFYIYKLDSSGLSGPGTYYFPDAGLPTQLKARPAGDMITFGNYIFDFDNATGTISNPTSLFLFSGDYGCSFSPNGRFLYITGLDSIFQQGLFQYDVNAANIAASRQVIMPPPYPIGTMSIAPDGKIYIAQRDSMHLAVINNPDLAGPGCNLVINGFHLGGKLSSAGLANFVDGYFDYSAMPCDSQVSIQEKEPLAERLEIYPNPAKCQVSIVFDNPLQVEHSLTIYDAQGRIIGHRTGIRTAKFSLDTAEWPGGLYFIQLSVGEQTRFRDKLIVE